MKARASRDYEFLRREQPLSGFTLGYEQKEVWRVLLEISPRQSFLSTRTYTSCTSAQRAADRINEKAEGRQS
jgi:hypothetical protein